MTSAPATGCMLLWEFRGPFVEFLVLMLSGPYKGEKKNGSYKAYYEGSSWRFWVYRRVLKCCISLGLRVQQRSGAGI